MKSWEYDIIHKPKEAYLRAKTIKERLTAIQIAFEINQHFNGSRQNDLRKASEECIDMLISTDRKINE